MQSVLCSTLSCAAAAKDARDSAAVLLLRSCVCSVGCEVGCLLRWAVPLLSQQVTCSAQHALVSNQLTTDACVVFEAIVDLADRYNFIAGSGVT